LLLAGAAPWSTASAVSVASGTADGVAADIWSWTDAGGNLRTVALKQEGNGNPGHGGYAVQFTYIVGTKTVTIKADSGSDGGFG
jgi:hypothetical protein